MRLIEKIEVQQLSPCHCGVFLMRGSEVTVTFAIDSAADLPRIRSSCGLVPPAIGLGRRISRLSSWSRPRWTVGCSDAGNDFRGSAVFTFLDRNEGPTAERISCRGA